MAKVNVKDLLSLDFVLLKLAVSINLSGIVALMIPLNEGPTVSVEPHNAPLLFFWMSFLRLIPDAVGNTKVCPFTAVMTNG